jgi:hypothetical protein
MSASDTGRRATREKPGGYPPYNVSADGSRYGSSDDVRSALSIYQRPTGLKGLWYNTYTQVALLGFVCFMCPGLFNALQGLGGGGQIDTETSANANSTLYATFAVAAFFAGCAIHATDFPSHHCAHRPPSAPSTTCSDRSSHYC